MDKKPVNPKVKTKAWQRRRPTKVGWYFALRGEEPVMTHVYNYNEKLCIYDGKHHALLTDYHDANGIRTYWFGPLEKYPDYKHLDRSEVKPKEDILWES